MKQSPPHHGATCSSDDHVGTPDPVVEIQRASDIDFQAYAAFQKEAYRDLLDRSKATDIGMTPEFYRWKYHSPDGQARIAWVTQGEETLSSSAMLPLRISYKGKSVIGWHCVDVATLPKVRRKGYLLATLRELMETVPPGDVFFAFPNSGSIGSFLRLGCVEDVILTTWINLMIPLIRKRSERIERVDGFGPHHDILESRVKTEAPHVDRRPDYLNWRYTDHPHNRYVSFVYENDGCEGICVVRKARVMGRDLALVMEIYGSTARIQAALVSHAADWAHSEGVGMMALMSTSLPLRTALRTLFAPVPTFLLPKRQVLVLHGAKKTPASLMRETWALQTGDWDVF